MDSLKDYLIIETKSPVTPGTATDDEINQIASLLKPYVLKNLKMTPRWSAQTVSTVNKNAYDTFRPICAQIQKILQPYEMDFKLINSAMKKNPGLCSISVGAKGANTFFIVRKTNPENAKQYHEFCVSCGWSKLSDTQPRTEIEWAFHNFLVNYNQYAKMNGMSYKKMYLISGCFLGRLFKALGLDPKLADKF